MTKGDIFGMRDGTVYCRLHYEMLQHSNGLPPGVLSNADVPCDLSCSGGAGGGAGGGGVNGVGPHHGLLPPANFGLSESMSPSHMMNILSSDGARLG